MPHFARVRRWAAAAGLVFFLVLPAAAAAPSGKIFVMGVGSVRLPVIERLVRQGRMPAFARLMKEGALAPELLNVYPNKSHTPWVSAATGAPAGTHRIISMMTSANGRPPYQQEMLGVLRQGEFLWEAAERQGKRSIVLNWPDSWPSRLTKGIQIGGASLSVNGVFHSGTAMVYRAPVHRFALGADEIYSSEPAEGHSTLRVLPIAEAGMRAAGAGDGVAVRVELSCLDSDREIVRKPVLWLVAQATGGPVRLFEDGKWEKPVASVEIGRWTERIDLQVATAAGPVAAVMRLKLLSLDAAGRKARIYATAVSAIRDGRVAPPNAAPELAALKSFPMPTPVFLKPYSAQYLDPESQLELLAMNGDWHIEALRVLLRRPFDLFVFHDNDVDWAEHSLNMHVSNGIPRERLEAMIDQAYMDLDRRMAAIMGALPAGTTLLVMSQHGIIAPWDRSGGEPTPAILEKAGLLVRNGEVIDYDKSVAFPAAESGLIHVQPKNPKTTEERALREKNMEATLHTLSAATDPGTRRRAFTVVLPWEDATPFGLYGPRHADIVALRPAPAGGIHGACWPLTAGGESTLKGMYLFWGAHARNGFREAGPVWPEDIAPTAARLLGIEAPADSSGRVLHRMLR